MTRKPGYDCKSVSGQRKNRSSHRAVKCSKDRQEFFVPRGGKPSPDSSGETNRRSRDEVGGQAMGRPNPPANEGNISRNGQGHWENYEEVRSRHEIITSV